MSVIQSASQFFESHYRERLGTVNTIDLSLTSSGNEPTQDIAHLQKEGLQNNAIIYTSPLLKPGNGPRIFHHNRKVDDVIVLTHGYTDSPYYLQAIAVGFYKIGFNVIMPLLPAHGLNELGEALEDSSLDSQWRKTIDHGVDTAAKLGERISIGGFSTGGALSLNKILNDRKNQINGGLFLFSAAISVGSMNEALTKVSFLQSIARRMEGALSGVGKDPFKYPAMSKAGGMEVAQIVNDNNRLLDGGKEKRKIKQPVFAAHSAHDKTATLNGLMDFMKEHVDDGVAMVVSQSVEHACLPLETDINLNPGTNELNYPPNANPKFKWMIKGILDFVNQEVRKNQTN